MRGTPAAAVIAVLVPGSIASAYDIILDQIGGSFSPTSLSSSQFPPGNTDVGITTIDNFSVPSTTVAGAPFRLTRIEATVAGLQNFNGFDLIDAWTIQIYSSQEASTQSIIGDVYSTSFDAPDELTTGFADWFGSPVELATFDVDILLDPGEYWLTIALANDSDINGTVGIAHGTIGDGPAFFSGPSLDDPVPLSNPAGYRIIGELAPAPGAAALLAMGLLCGPRRRRQAAES